MLRMQCPITSLMPQTLCASSKQHRSIRFGKDEEVQYPKETRHDERDPLRPSPAKIAFCHEGTNDWAKDWTGKERASERRHSEASFSRIPEIGERTSQRSRGRRTEEALEEAEDHDGLDVCCDCDWDLEDGEYEEAGEERNLSTIQLTERAISGETSVSVASNEQRWLDRTRKVLDQSQSRR